MIDYRFKTEPFRHQAAIFERSRDKDNFAIFAGMGTGKSKIIIDTAAWLYSKGEIDALVVVAPNGVHRNWLIKEVPAHMPDHIEVIGAWWRSTPNAKEKRALGTLWNPADTGLRIFAVNTEALSHKKSSDYLRKFIRLHSVLMVVDESSRIKTPGAKATKKAIALGKLCKYRRILTGTAVTQGPMDLYSQMKFLDVWILGFQTFTAFKHHFAEWERIKTDKNRLGYFEQLVEFKNLDELRALLRPDSVIIKKEECLDLPPKVYYTRMVSMNPEQSRMYKDMVKDGVALLDPRASADGDTLWDLLVNDEGKIRSKTALEKLLRLQQITGGFATIDGVAQPIAGINPKVTELLNIIEEAPGKMIIWARFRAELATIEQALTKRYGRNSVVSYHGGVKDDERAFALESFEEGEARFFVGNPQSGGIGLTLIAASTVVYFSNDFSLEKRLQSEDRAHRIGQTKSVAYIDLIAEKTVDTKVREALKKKDEVAEDIMRSSGI